MGSRFGGLKQIEPLGQNGETVAEFSVYDAIRAGFTRVVFIIKPEMEAVFRERVIARFAHAIRCDLAFQRDDDVPAGCSPPTGRKKPLGTAHAVWSCREVVNEPFLVINADDFYGASPFTAVRERLLANPDQGAPHPYCMAAYALRDTVSEYGSVSRGVCVLDAQRNLRSVVERTRIERQSAGLCAVEATEDGAERIIPLAEDTPVSMNAWGLHPSVFGAIEEVLRQHLAQPTEALLKAECYLPTVVAGMIAGGQATVRALRTHDRWIGITYIEDLEPARRMLLSLIDAGVYPRSLWG
jgi:NDP-sugar pyrophosphorylase family protein